MLTVLMQDGRSTHRIAAALGSCEPVVWADRWDEFERALPCATCAIVVLGWLRGSDLDARRLGSLKERHPLRPTVLVTSKDADNARALRWMAIDEVVWLSEIDGGLWPAVRRARANVVRQHLTGAVDRALLLDPPLQRAMRYACNAERPVRSIGQLATACGCDRRTLWRHWHQAVADRVALRLEDVLDWLLLLCAVGRKTPARSWSNVAAEIQIHPHTLGRIAARLTDRPLRRLASIDQVPLTLQFHAHLIAALVGEPARSSVTRFEPSRLLPALVREPLGARRSG
jgi:hypothetical protein